ncbi:AI-2E family transporter [Nocardioides marmoriginsengisoli]|uniref:AI-2E family transporter n=1 Tax=Nocardioides marmoriginsengisoli TaxID=661483 RepID=A0A3N0CE60_9ACTN|nr:AI-2E family transporter [Nocardioides marmoriginsengisoli]RNL61293.1 AI-2E family transporter [Nocardioides marmoriginsengisoli]
MTDPTESAGAAERTQELENQRVERVARKVELPWAYELAAAWSWRFLVIAAAAGLVFAGLSYFSVVVFPVVIALFIAALCAPLVSGLQRIGLPRKLAALAVVVGGIAVVGLLLAFVGQQVADSVDQLSGKVAGGLGEIRNWLRDGPLNASDSQVDTWIEDAQSYLQDQGKGLAGRATELGVAVGHIFAGFFIVLFATYFFLADGRVIWGWVVRIFPRAAREKADSSGQVAWRSLTQFVRATVLVAATDAIGIMIFALILKVPLVSAIGVLVFLGAFVPLVGAFASGTVAVLVALVAHGPIVAAIMLGGVVLVQQIEAHVLQPFLMGRFVSVHPLGVILGIAAGVIVAGVIGALVAVPLVAALNAVVQHLASFADPEVDDPEVDDPGDEVPGGEDPEPADPEIAAEPT